MLKASSAADDLVDVLIIGAGLSGIGAARHLQRHCPGKRFAIFEAREAIGGTWDLFRYPGVRSDSDMHTLGYAFKPWTDAQAIADGPAILRYIREAAMETGIDRHIRRFGCRVVAAAWSSADACWTVSIETAGKTETMRARFLYCCSGYYSYEEAHRPEFPGEADFHGAIVQPQFWPRELDYAGKRVVVIGSGATAVTLVPAMAERAAHVTLLQRSPSYVVTRPGRDPIGERLGKLLPARPAYALTRWKNVMTSMLLYRLARSRPDRVKAAIQRMAAEQLGPGIDAGNHFSPRYKPRDQRVCVAPDADLFAALREARASVITDRIARFTPRGLLLESGAELAADVVVMATGLKLRMLGGMNLCVDGKPVRINEAIAYRGMMLSDVPNFAMAFGYTNASWTLKADLTAGYVCRLLRRMDRRGVEIAVPRREKDVEPQPLLDFSSGYVQRGLGALPSQGTRSPWRVHQNYLRDLLLIRYGRVDDGVMRFGRRGALP